VKKKNLEVCAECSEFPCSKFEGWTEDGEEVYDSFLTHRKAMPNLNFIKEHGLEQFARQQKKRMELLETMLQHFDEGRSKSFYCIATALLSITNLETALNEAGQEIGAKKIGADDIKTKSRTLRGLLNDLAVREGIDLRLRKKG